MQILRVQYFNSVNLTIVEVGSFYFFFKDDWCNDNFTVHLKRNGLY